VIIINDVLGVVLCCLVLSCVVLLSSRGTTCVRVGGVVWWVYGRERRAKGGEEVPRGSGLLYVLSRHGTLLQGREGELCVEKARQDKTRQDKTRQAARHWYHFFSQVTKSQVPKYPGSLSDNDSESAAGRRGRAEYIGTLGMVGMVCAYLIEGGGEGRGGVGGRGRGRGKGKGTGEADVGDIALQSCLHLVKILGS